MDNRLKQYISNNLPLIAFFRGGHPEAVHQGSVVITKSDGSVISCAGNAQMPVVMRSCAKPFQLITVLRTGAAEKYGFTPEELAVSAASHSGDEIHMAAVRNMMKKVGITEDDLRCGVHEPFANHVVKQMARDGQHPTTLTNNCSGKHTSMIAACLAYNWNPHEYELPDHPMQKENLEVTARFAGVEPEDVGIAFDGCTVPTFCVPLAASATAYARVADRVHAPQQYDKEAETVFNVMNNHPEYGSSATSRLEYALMSLFPGKVIAKVGAEGLFCVGIAPGVLGNDGFGVAVKLEDGVSFNRASDPIVVAALHQIGLIKDEHLPGLAEFVPQVVMNNRGFKAGHVEILFNLK